METQAVGTGGGPILPTGTVTFLLTDIEASTSGWETHPERMALAVPRHYEILDDAIARWGGARPVEQGEGDSVVAAFSRASEAVQAALDAQRALLGELGDTVAVRIALHTGEAQLRDEGNYFGPAVIRCARLRSCGHGGQILLSHASADLVAGRLPDDASLLDLGEHQLKDLQRSERVFELCHPSLPRAGRFPPLRSHVASAHNLPAAMTPLIGRQTELSELAELVTAERLVTLTGTGGCGKTRLALEVAGRLVDRFDGGVWWCELATRSEDDAVAILLAALLGESEATGSELIEAVAARLRVNGSSLVVLDNAEHVLEGVARFAADLLRRAPGTHLLVTSREPLSLPGEVAWRVPSLGVPPAAGASHDQDGLAEFAAVRLFVERAARARSGFGLNERNADSVVSICRRLDGIPLAIELAAARVRTMSPDRIAAHLDDRFRLLSGGARTLLPRQQTLLASFAWSEALLDDAERASLRRLGVFVGGFTLEAAEDVLGSFDDTDINDVVDLVGHLVDKSLVMLDDSGRYRLLESIRSFSLTRLVETDEANAARDAHADWARRFTADHDATFNFHTAPDASFETMDAEWPNIVTAMEWLWDRAEELMQLVAASRLFLTRQRPADAFKYGYENIRRFIDAPPASWYRAVTATGPALYNLGIEHIALTVQARELALRAGDELAVLRCDLLLLIERMRTRLGSEDLAEAGAIAARASALGDSLTEHNALSVSWQSLIGSGRMTEATTDAPMPVQRGLIAAVRAVGASYVGELARAAELLRGADLTSVPSDADWIVVASAAEWLAAVSGERHTVDEHRSPPLDEHLYQGLWREFFYLHDLRHAMRRGDWQHAVQFASAERLTFSDRHSTWIDALLVPSLVAAGEREDARRRAEVLVQMAAPIGAPLQEIEGHLVLAELDGVESHAYEALALARRHNLVLAQIDALEMLAILASSAEYAAQLKVSAAAERERRDYLFRWPTRAVLLDAVATDAEPLELARMVALALGER